MNTSDKRKAYIFSFIYFFKGKQNRLRNACGRLVALFTHVIKAALMMGRKVLEIKATDIQGEFQ